MILDHQSREDEDINGKDTLIKYETGFPRYPFVLLLDGVVSHSLANSAVANKALLFSKDCG